jgi:hypothetical protein
MSIEGYSLLHSRMMPVTWDPGTRRAYVWEAKVQIMLASIVESAICLVAGWYGRDVIKILGGHYSKWRIVGRRETFERDRSAALDWVINYYGGESNESRLFRLPSGRPIAYLSRSAWQFPSLSLEKISFIIESELCTTPVSRRELNYRRRLGQRLWDGPVYYLGSGIMQDGNLLHINLRRGTYFQYATLSGRLQREVNKCIHSRRRRPTIRNKIADSLGHIQTGRPCSQLLGFGVAMVLASPEGWKVLVQDRSHDAGVAGGTRAAIPAYVCEPTDDMNGGELNPFRDFLREFSEELYFSQHQEQLGQLRADWFYELEPVKRLIQLRDNGKFAFEVTGFGFDALTVELHFAAIAVVLDETFAERELRRMNRNWEANGIRVVDIDSDAMTEIIESESTYPTSAFVFALARTWLKEKRRTDPRFQAANHDKGSGRRRQATSSRGRADHQPDFSPRHQAGAAGESHPGGS